MFKVKNKSTRTTLFTSFGVCIVNFEHILHNFSSVSDRDFEQVNVSWNSIE